MTLKKTATLLFFFGFLAPGFLALSALGLKTCQAESLGFSIEANQSSQNLLITVLDDQTLLPLAETSILLSDLTGFAQNTSAADYFLTNTQGNLSIPQGSLGLKVVTAFKEGYGALTVAGVQSSRLTLFLKPLEKLTPDVLASGVVGGWDTYETSRSKPVKVGLIFKALSALDLLQFSVESVVSPLKDSIDVFGERLIPSNIVMPEQTIPVYFTSVKVNKPGYRLLLPSQRKATLTAVEGEIDSGDLIDIGQAGQITAASLNQISLTQIGVSPVLLPQADLNYDLNARLALAPAHWVSVSPPPFNSDVVIAAMTDLNGDGKFWIPTDIKSPISATPEKDPMLPIPLQSTPLKSTATPMGQSRAVMGAALSRDKKLLSGVIAAQAPTQLTLKNFLAPTALEDTESLPEQIRFESTAPKTLGVALFEGQFAQGDLKKKYPVWTVFTLPAAGNWPLATAKIPLKDPIVGYSVLKLEFDPTFNENQIRGDQILNSLQRFTRASAQIGTP